jgi:hypothetical protein
MMPQFQNSHCLLPTLFLLFVTTPVRNALACNNGLIGRKDDWFVMTTKFENTVPGESG